MKHIEEYHRFVESLQEREEMHEELSWRDVKAAGLATAMSIPGPHTGDVASKPDQVTPTEYMKSYEPSDKDTIKPMKIGRELLDKTREAYRRRVSDSASSVKELEKYYVESGFQSYTGGTLKKQLARLWHIKNATDSLGRPKYVLAKGSARGRTHMAAEMQAFKAAQLYLSNKLEGTGVISNDVSQPVLLVYSEKGGMYTVEVTLAVPVTYPRLSRK